MLSIEKTSRAKDFLLSYTTFFMLLSLVFMSSSFVLNGSVFQNFCMDFEESHIKLLLHKEVRRLSKGNCLSRFVELFNEIMAFLPDFQDERQLHAKDGKSFVADTFLTYLTS